MRSMNKSQNQSLHDKIWQISQAYNKSIILQDTLKILKDNDRPSSNWEESSR